MTSTNKLEKVQQRALRFINNDFTSSLNELLKLTNTQPLHVRRLKLMACEIYKIVNDLSPQFISDLVNIKVSPYDFRGEKKADIPKVNSTRYGLSPFGFVCCFFNFTVMCLDVPFDKFQGVISFGGCLVYMSIPCEVI